MPNLLPQESELSSDSSIAYQNGRWIRLEDLAVSPNDLGFRQAVTAVERLRTYNGNFFQLDAHLRRFRISSSELSIDGLPSDEVIVGTLLELLNRNSQLLHRLTDVGITMFATPGKTAAGEPTFVLHLNELNFDLIRQRRNEGQPLVVTDVQQPPPESWPRGIKVRCRLHYYLADQAAARIDGEALGVLKDNDGTITETSVCNIAIVESGSVVSPMPVRLLHGVTQQVIQDVAQSQGIDWRHESISSDRMRHANEVLLMGTGTGIWFANRVDEITIGDGNPGKVFRALEAGFDRQTAQN